MVNDCNTTPTAVFHSGPAYFDTVQSEFPARKHNPDAPPGLYSAILEITTFLTRFLWRKIPRYRVEMFAQRFSNRLIQRLRKVEVRANEAEQGENEPMKRRPKKYLIPDLLKEELIQKQSVRLQFNNGAGSKTGGPSAMSRSGLRHFRDWPSSLAPPARLERKVVQKLKTNVMAGIGYELVVSVYDELAEEYDVDEVVVEACVDCCLNVVEVLRKFPPNMVIRCVEGAAYAIFDQDGDAAYGFQIFPRQSAESVEEETRRLSGPDENDTSTTLSSNEPDTLSEGSFCGSAARGRRVGRKLAKPEPEPEPEADDTIICPSVASNAVPYRVQPKARRGHASVRDVYQVDIQIRQVPKFDYARRKTVWVDEFCISQRDPRFTAQTFAGTRFGSVKLKSHQYSDRGAGFYHFTMPSVLPIIQLLANGVTCATLMNEFAEEGPKRNGARPRHAP